jgi:hypothetical protein
MVEDLGFNLGRSNRTISSPKHPDQFQQSPKLQLKENHSFISGIKVANAHTLTTHICLEPRLKISGATPKQNPSAFMAHSRDTLI